VAKGRSIFGAAVLAAALCGGCASQPKQAPVSAAHIAAPASVPKKDRVLWEYKQALSAMRKGDFAQAKELFDDAITTISGIYGKDASAKKSRGYFNEEAKKNFIGEPYERAMAYWYRGVLYWMDGEPDNARACFRSAQLIDSDTENKEYSADYASLDYLDGLATVKLNGDGSDQFKSAQKLSKIGALPPYNKDANVLVFLEFGNGPTKYATGEHSEQLRIRPGYSQAAGAWVRVANKAVKIGPYDDLNYQASTRGGRVMDHILANKAVFKSGADTFGNVALIGGGVAAMQHSGRHDMGDEIGLGLVAAGVLSKILSAATTPQADTRAWDNLPQFVSFTALQLPPGTYNGTVDFTDAAGNIIAGLTKNFTFTTPAPNGHDAVLFLSDKSS
jgi:tetratricopeptide (TPR) repeat protein